MTDLAILNHGQVSRKTSEPAPPFQATTPHHWMSLSRHKFNVHHGESSMLLGLELMTHSPRARPHDTFCAYHSTTFTVEWSVCKSSIAWPTLDAEPQTCPPQWCDERRMWAAEWNEVVFIDESSICLQHHDGRIRVWRKHMYRYRNAVASSSNQSDNITGTTPPNDI
ncbi:uncharacterized protein TNCV_1629091 [Trichonephila clavipes]|uniref:Uncharacterized protein n=1 Tax=Trichonephila clavipes TaxID=2585209 RepID=A0A8X6W9U0_TRICX|nr:uncharacterized protein TNCV_1629091 [Trichonephila clavipes]